MNLIPERDPEVEDTSSPIRMEQESPRKTIMLQQAFDTAQRFDYIDNSVNWSKKINKP